MLRDCRRKGLHEAFFAHLRAQAEGHARLVTEIDATAELFASLLDGDEAIATLRIRAVGSRMSWLQASISSPLCTPTKKIQQK